MLSPHILRMVTPDVPSLSGGSDALTLVVPQSYHAPLTDRHTYVVGMEIECKVNSFRGQLYGGAAAVGFLRAEPASESGSAAGVAPALVRGPRPAAISKCTAPEPREQGPAEASKSDSISSEEPRPAKKKRKRGRRRRARPW